MYAHLLDPADSELNFLSPTIAKALAQRFGSHKAGDQRRAETNTVASQPCCFNLFVPLAQDLELASHVFTDLMGSAVEVDHIELEFTPNRLKGIRGYDLGERDESLGDQSGNVGTDADGAVFYQVGSERGVLLIEFKYIESEFSRCGTYHSSNAERKRLVRPSCDSPDFVRVVTAPQRDTRGAPLCGYAKYANWDLTQKSRVFDWIAISAAERCPFRGSTQQLWRNLLLAENVARQRGLQRFDFWVVSPTGNHALWQEHGRLVDDDVRVLLQDPSKFARVTVERMLAAIEARLAPDDDRRQWWVEGFQTRYLPELSARPDA